MEVQWNEKQSIHQWVVWSTSPPQWCHTSSQSLPSILNIVKSDWRGTGPLPGLSSALRKPLGRRLQLTSSCELSVYGTAELWLRSRKMRKKLLLPMDPSQYSQHLTQKEVLYFLPTNALIRRSISYFSCKFLHQYSNCQKSNRSSSRNRFLEQWMAQIKERDKKWFVKYIH